MLGTMKKSRTKTPRKTKALVSGPSTPKRARTHKLSRRPSVKDVQVAVDPALKAAWDELAARLSAAMGVGAKAFDELWEAAGEAIEHEPPLYPFGGYKSPAEFFEQHLRTDARTAQRNVRVAKYATPDEEETYGVTNLDAAIAYIIAKFGPIQARLPVAFDKLRIEVRDGARVGRVPFRELTAPQIARATRALHGKPAKHRARSAIEATFAKHPALKGIHVNEHGGRVTFIGVPGASLGVFAQGIGRVKI